MVDQACRQKLAKIGEDITETLEARPRQYEGNLDSAGEVLLPAKARVEMSSKHILSQFRIKPTHPRLIGL
jgi:hypothetical protein